MEDILKSCDPWVLRYMTGVRRQDRVSSEEVPWRCCLMKSNRRIRQPRLQWFDLVRREAEGKC